MYAYCNDPLLLPPPPVDPLPCGLEHVIYQHILKGTDQLINKVYPEAMGQGSAAEKEKIGHGLGGILPWVGDQHSIDCMQGLGHICHDAVDAWAWLAWSGWPCSLVFFHAETTYASLLHAQYFGMASGIGLHKAFKILNQKGLGKVDTKGINVNQRQLGDEWCGAERESV